MTSRQSLAKLTAHLLVRARGWHATVILLLSNLFNPRAGEKHGIPVHGVDGRSFNGKAGLGEDAAEMQPRPKSHITNVIYRREREDDKHRHVDARLFVKKRARHKHRHV